MPNQTPPPVDPPLTPEQAFAIAAHIAAAERPAANADLTPLPPNWMDGYEQARCDAAERVLALGGSPVAPPDADCGDNPLPR